ncbi:hypothetical protein [Acaryochloris sp. CCMEE 5410]|nr:hypothetical protein [Acaryochloris sp. CCMEE 5410]KAI9131533.1 hypothetical protein ON05_028485 [Acaryochloris sp. CCMEE 5410]
MGIDPHEWKFGLINLVFGKKLPRIIARKERHLNPEEICHALENGPKK